MLKKQGKFEFAFVYFTITVLAHKLYLPPVPNLFIKSKCDMLTEHLSIYSERKKNFVFKLLLCSCVQKDSEMKIANRRIGSSWNNSNTLVLLRIFYENINTFYENT